MVGRDGTTAERIQQTTVDDVELALPDVFHPEGLAAGLTDGNITNIDGGNIEVAARIGRPGAQAAVGNLLGGGQKGQGKSWVKIILGVRNFKLNRSVFYFRSDGLRVAAELHLKRFTFVGGEGRIEPLVEVWNAEAFILAVENNVGDRKVNRSGVGDLNG